MIKKHSGGASAQKGFNFQTISGLFYGFVFTYNQKDFSVEFEDIEDVIVKTGAEVFSIQAKSGKISESMLNKKDKFEKSIIDKLVEVSYEESTVYRIVAFPLMNASGDILKLKKEIILTDLEYRSMTVDYEEIKKIFLHEMPFIANLESAKIYIMGYAAKNIGPLSEQLLDSLIVRANELSELPPNNEKKIGLNTEFFESYLITNAMYKETEDFCNRIITLTGSWVLSKQVCDEIAKFREKINPNLEKVKQISFEELGDGNLIEFATDMAREMKLSKASVLAYYFMMEVKK